LVRDHDERVDGARKESKAFFRQPHSMAALEAKGLGKERERVCNKEARRTDKGAKIKRRFRTRLLFSSRSKGVGSLYGGQTYYKER